MKINRLLSLASLIIALALGGVGYILVPIALWSYASIAAFVMLIGATSLMLHPTFALPNETIETDAAIFAAIGPVAVYLMMLFAWNGATFIVSILGYEQISYAMMVVGFANLLLLFIYVKIGGHIVNKSARSTLADRQRLDYKGVLEAYAPQIESLEGRKLVQQIIEEINYAPSSTGDIVASEDQSITNLVNELIAHGRSVDQVSIEAFATKVRATLALRQSMLTLHRTKR